MYRTIRNCSCTYTTILLHTPLAVRLGWFLSGLERVVVSSVGGCSSLDYATCIPVTEPLAYRSRYVLGTFAAARIALLLYQFSNGTTRAVLGSGLDGVRLITRLESRDLDELLPCAQGLAAVAAVQCLHHMGNAGRTATYSPFGCISLGYRDVRPLPWCGM